MIPTAAIDGTSDCPGEPCDTSMPRMIVGTFETTGIEGVCSIANIEFSPPSCEQIMIEMLAGLIKKETINLLDYLLKIRTATRRTT